MQVLFFDASIKTINSTPGGLAMRLASKLLLAAVVATPHCVVEAEDLKLIGQILPARLELFADRDSVKKMGELTLITLVLPVDSTSTDSFRMTFDCDKGTYRDQRGIFVSATVPLRWSKEKTQYAMSNDALPNALTIACEPR